jgi:CheY-like chemotaxis protein
MSPFTVLVVDDELVVRELVAAHLRQRGFTVITAPDGQAAQQVLEVRRVDLLVLDLEMPNRNGHQVLRWVRVEQPLVRSVVLTGAASMTAALDCLRAGATAFVVKPFTDTRALDRAIDLAVQALALWREQLEMVRRRRVAGVERP